MNDAAPATSSRPADRIAWRQVGVLYTRELRAALRERNIVINSILLPIVLYPFIMWAIFSGIMFVQGQTAGMRSRIHVPAWPAGHPELRDSFMADDRLVLVPADLLADDPAALVARARLDAVVVFEPAQGAAAALPDNFVARIIYDASKERSTTARHRIAALIEQHRSAWLGRAAETRGIAPADWQLFTLLERNVASPRQTGAFILGMMLPLFFVIMVAMGSFYPAVDAIAGERERQTWETLLSTAASRLSIVTAKYLYVASLGGLAGILNLGAMILTLGPIFAPMIASSGGELHFALPWGALPVLALAAILLAGFVAAGMMILASFARTFKEGQAMITPFYLVIMLPVMFLQTPGLSFTPGLACLPVVNVVMLIRSAINGSFPPLPIAITLVISVLLIAASLRLAASMLRFEDVMLGSYDGNFRRFLRERMFKRTPRTGNLGSHAR